MRLDDGERPADDGGMQHERISWQSVDSAVRLAAFAAKQRVAVTHADAAAARLDRSTARPDEAGAHARRVRLKAPGLDGRAWHWAVRSRG